MHREHSSTRAENILDMTLPHVKSEIPKGPLRPNISRNGLRNSRPFANTGGFLSQRSGVLGFKPKVVDYQVLGDTVETLPEARVKHVSMSPVTRSYFALDAQSSRLPVD